MLTDLNLVHKINERLVGTLDFDELTQKITAMLVNELGLQGCTIFRVDSKHRCLRSCAFNMKSNAARMLQIIGKPFSSLATPIDKPLNYIGQTAAFGKIIHGRRLRDFISPTVGPVSADAIARITHANYLLSLPIKFKGAVVGALLVGHRDSDFTESGVSLLKTAAAQLGLAMGNVMAHERIIERYKESLAKGEKKVAKIPKIKFTLRITPEIEQYLTFKVANTKESKAEYVRKLLEELMEKDEGYKKFQGPQ